MSDREDHLKEITRSMTYTTPKLGDNVVKFGKMVRVCTTRSCYEPVFVSEIFENGGVRYTCSKHGIRNRSQMDWLDITGSTMIEFRKVGL